MHKLVEVDPSEHRTDTPVLNRIFIYGPAVEIEGFRALRLRELGCPCCGGRMFIFADPPATNGKSLRWNWSMKLVEEEDEMLRLECHSREKMSAEFLAHLANPWPALRFNLECWAAAGGFALVPQTESSQPRPQDCSKN